MHQQPSWLREKNAGPGRVHARHFELYPRVTCVAVGVALFGFYNAWDFTENPDMNLHRRRRETPTWERYQRQEGERYMAYRAPFAHLRANCAASNTEDEKIWGKQRDEDRAQITGDIVPGMSLDG